MGQHSPHLMSEFKRITCIYDRLRGESMIELVPELQSLMDEKNNTGNTLNRLKLTISHGKWLADRLKDQLFK